VALRATPNETFLRLAFRSAVGSVLAGSIYAAVAPGRAQPAPKSAVAANPDDAPIGKSECEARRYINVHLLHPSIPLDYLSSRSEGHTWTAVGLPCRGAKDRKSCDAAIVAADQARAGGAPYLLGTRGDRVLTCDDPEQWLAVIGRIEDVDTAAQFLRFKGIEYLMCPVLQVADGFLFETREVTDITLENVERGMVRRMHLSADGNVTSLGAHPFEQKLYIQVMQGRRPPGLLSIGPRADSLGAHFAGAAMHEAASVHAFMILAAELRALGAPSELAERCEVAAMDEIRHAEQMSRLARRFGRDPHGAVIAPVPLRSASQLALDNAVEGCVHETYAALIALYQARSAEDPAIRAELSTIAEDETRHATLSWDIDRWLRPRLTSGLQASVVRAQRQAVDNLRNARELMEDEDDRRLAGVPSAAHCRQMIDCLAPQLWTA
jgi:hypothetical protein